MADFIGGDVWGQEWLSKQDSEGERQKISEVLWNMQENTHWN